MARVLVVENDPATRMLLALHLESDTPTTSSRPATGAKASSQAIRRAPDLILSTRACRNSTASFRRVCATTRAPRRFPSSFTDPDDGDARTFPAPCGWLTIWWPP